MKKTGIGILVVVLIIIGFGGWYYLYGPCGTTRVEEAITELELLEDEWQDTVQLASSTSRMALSGPIRDLQQIKRDVDTLDVPDCLQDAQSNFVEAIEFTIDAFIGFVAEDPEISIQNQFEISVSRYQRYTEQKLNIVACSPICNLVDLP